MRDSYTSQDHSVGVIAYCQTQGQIRYLLIHQTKSSDRSFPKGHAEGNETPTQAALRELQEETGVTQVTLGDTIYTDYYQFEHKGMTVHKTVDYYLGESTQCRSTAIQPEETTEAGWYTYDEAMSLLTHEESKKLLKQVHATQ